MTEVNDWNSLSEELEAIKAIARHEGYQAALQDISDREADLKERQTQLRNATEDWQKILNRIRTNWAAASKQPESTRIPGSNKYRPIFGHNLEPIGQQPVFRFINMIEDMDEFCEALIYMATQAADFQFLLDSFETNPMVKQQWERLLVMMRMTEK